MKGKIKLGEGVYHIFGRGHNGMVIFKEDYDFKKFLYLAERFRKKYKCEIRVFVLMNNHFHIQIRSARIQMFISRLVQAYTGYFCTRYNHQTRVFAPSPEPVLKKALDWQIDNALYILNNPVEAKLAKSAGDYKWSSYHFYTQRRSSLKQIITVSTNFIHINFESIKSLQEALKPKLMQMQSMKNYKQGPSATG